MKWTRKARDNVHWHENIKISRKTIDKRDRKDKKKKQ